VLTERAMVSLSARIPQRGLSNPALSEQSPDLPERSGDRRERVEVLYLSQS
jgi:hypothetical protein